MKTLVLVNVLTSVHAAIYSNHIALFNKMKQDFPKDEFILFTPERSSIDNARNTAAVMAMEVEADYLLFLDDDVLVPSDSFTRLKKANKDIIAGLVMIRGYPFNVMLFKEVFKDKNGKSVRSLDFYNDIPVGGGNFIVPCGAVGFSLCLLKVNVLKIIPPPLFVTGSFHTEDVYFCEKYREVFSALNKTVEIYADTSIQCGHMMGPEAITYAEREKFKSFYKPDETLLPSQIDVIKEALPK